MVLPIYLGISLLFTAFSLAFWLLYVFVVASYSWMISYSQGKIFLKRSPKLYLRNVYPCLLTLYLNSVHFTDSICTYKVITSTSTKKAKTFFTFQPKWKNKLNCLWVKFSALSTIATRKCNDSWNKTII